MLRAAASYEDAVAGFRWQVPARYNIGVDICDRHDPAALALIHEDEDGSVRRYSFGEIAQLSNRLANALLAGGLKPGDRVGILMPQRPETAIAHVACYKAGLIAVPLFTLFGPEALEYRLGNAGCRALVT
ncbi:AMP-binding protein, partial [Oceanibaculum nanhaiense]|uniref:AMP-binding protein n=1 Tax=Oceanibaculum nanhaiense TaxID=1909734 RepID=UPI00396DFB75